MIKYGIYRHFKGSDKLYKVVGVAKHSETLEDMAIYIQLYGKEIGKVYVRPLHMFYDKVPEDKENPNNQKKRFEYLHD